MTAPRDILIQTLEDVAATDVPEDLRQIAFGKVFDLHVGGLQANPNQSVRGAGSGAPGHHTPGSANELEAIAAKAAVDREIVGEVYEMLEGNLELIIPAGKLADRTASGTKEIALLIAGGRQAAGLEDWTSLDVIRAVCADFKRLDSGNFAKTIKQMEDVFNVRKESERKTLVRMSRPGWEAFGRLVNRLGGGS